MFQFNVAGATWANYLYVDLYDKAVKNDVVLTQEPIFSITSQQTGKEKLFFPYTMNTTTMKDILILKFSIQKQKTPYFHL